MEKKINNFIQFFDVIRLASISFNCKILKTGQMTETDDFFLKELLNANKNAIAGVKKLPRKIESLQA